MNKLGKNKDDQKRANWGTALKLIATKRCCSRIDLSKMMGLTKAAISQIVSDMITQGYVEEAEKEQRMESGRNPVKLVISSKAPKFVGVLIERTYCAAVLCDLNLNIIKKKVIKKEWTEATDLLEHVFEVTDAMMTEDAPISAIGVAAIGPVNITEGVILNPFYFHGIHDIRIQEILEQRYHLPVYFDHDNQSATVAEFLYGNGRGYQDILLIGIGKGIGCGIMVQGHRIHSTYGFAPEIGHISIDYQGVECICGLRGCMEQYINTEIMTKRFQEITGRSLTYEQYMNLLDDPQMDQYMQDCIEKLSIGLVSILNVLNSQIVLLGMACCFWPDRYIRQLEEMVNKTKFADHTIRVPIKKVSFLTDAQLLGAACNAIGWIFDGKSPREV